MPRYVDEEFEAYLKCGRLEHGFLRVRCERCHAEKLVAFSCKRRGFCPSCGGRRMAETAALLVDELLPRQPIRHWVLSLPFALRYLLATRPEVLTGVLEEPEYLVEPMRHARELIYVPDIDMTPFSCDPEATHRFLGTAN